MHDQIMVTSGMDHQTGNHLAHDGGLPPLPSQGAPPGPPPGPYGQEQHWVDMNAYHAPTHHQHHQNSPMSDYGHGFAYPPPPMNHALSMGPGLSSESLSRMPPPPTPSPGPMAQVSHVQLPMLMMPSQPTWPSMLTNPSSYSPHPTPPALAPLQHPNPPQQQHHHHHHHHQPMQPMQPLQPQPLHSQQPQPHHQLPSIPPQQQTQRSMPAMMPSLVPSLRTSNTKLPSLNTMAAVSQPRKTLTNDDRRRMCQYAEDHPGAKQTDIGSLFGVERSTVSKVLRDKEKYLRASAENRSNSPITKRIKGKGQDIERALTNYVRQMQKNGHVVTPQQVKDKVSTWSATMNVDSTSLWVEKFIQKHGIGSDKLLRRASEANISESVRASPLASSVPPSAIPPHSPAAVHSTLSPLSAVAKTEDEKDDGGALSAMTETATSSFSGSAISPGTGFTFSPDVTNGPGFLPSNLTKGDAAHGQDLGPGFQRPRSQTFPTLDLEYLSQPQTNEPPKPKFTTAPSSALESPPDNDASGPRFALDRTVSSPQLRRSASNTSLARSAATPAGGSSPISPTQEDARKAADTLLTFIQSAAGFVDQNEYMTVVRLTEKLRLHQTQMAKAGMGGLTRIPEADTEMANASPAAAPLKVASGA